uniref:Uncharacterized protein MANES_03G180900 n=1 Tax=Rhizophora mucronata TaxID=61149 RepID=A0A2P2LQZ1_RHIMU
MQRPPLLPVTNVTIQNWKKMKLYLCQEMKLRNSPHQEKMGLMHCVKHICGTLIVPSLGILGCGLSCLKPPLALPWSCATVFLFDDHMRAMTDI